VYDIPVTTRVTRHSQKCELVPQKHRLHLRAVFSKDDEASDMVKKLRRPQYLGTLKAMGDLVAYAHRPRLRPHLSTLPTHFVHTNHII
jgi:hypothetical protein